MTTGGHILKPCDNASGNALDTIRASQAIVRNLAPADLVGTVHWLISDASHLVTGQTIAVDGGTVMH
jgi:NAD(P)-dependent dehydrogenase (short-subunit alcohol dehydrogenase family)